MLPKSTPVKVNFGTNGLLIWTGRMLVRREREHKLPFRCPIEVSEVSMFDQTFVDAQQVTKRPLTLALSLLLQVSVICLLILVPLLYTQVLPVAVFKNLLIAPASPRPEVPTPPEVKASPKLIARTLDLHKLFAPIAIPKKVAAVDQLTSAPDIGLAAVSDPGAGATQGIVGIIGSVPVAPAPPPDMLQPKKKSPTGPLVVASVLEEANLVQRVMPVYPPLAKTARIQGMVEFTALISKTGTIENLKLVHGHPLLVTAAREAVEQWRYRPTLLNGVPVEIVTDIIVNFTLNQ